MGVEALLFGSVLSAGIGAASAAHTQAANAAAQSALNKETMKFNREEAEKARDWSAEQSLQQQGFNAEQALLARQFSERMSATAHQREAADLKAAGLNPILAANSGANVGASPVASATLPTSSAASVGSMNAYKKDNVMTQFVSSALDGVRASNDLKRAQAADKEADAAAKNAVTNARRQVQDALESMSKITNIDSNTVLNKWKALSEEKQVELFKEKITSEIRERTDKHNLSEAQQQAVMISANAAATAASAQAHMADIQDRIQTAESPERINKLKKEASYWQSQFDKNQWIMSDPEVIMKREWWKNNEGAAGVKEAADIVGKVFHGGMFLPIK